MWRRGLRSSTSPATLRHQIKIEARGRDSPPTITIPITVNHADSGSFKESMEAQRGNERDREKVDLHSQDGVNSAKDIVPDTESLARESGNHPQSRRTPSLAEQQPAEIRSSQQDC